MDTALIHYKYDIKLIKNRQIIHKLGIEKQLKIIKFIIK